MIFAIISDIHGNLQALEKVLNDIESRKPDRVICLGDLVGYGANPNEVIDRIRQCADVVLAGNHDHAAIGLTDITVFNQFAFNAAIWTRKILTPENHEYLTSVPFTHSEDDLYFTHASPHNPEDWHYIFTRYDAEYAMEHAPTGIVFIGHTHVPNDHQTRNGRLINVGSVGQPRDGDPRAAYTLFDNQTGERRLIRLDYDIKSAGKAILKAGLPKFLAERLVKGR
ncbi:MAG: metallophosphoesterase family protein [Candidatus Electryonea clarkiae]|nr:metallophosphoesterase family protein [Candidatus Electryonea clarkiae]MDP8286831.1 metallophosphoesterase family protein [Candidatus Electryonea clarkiae]